MLHTASLAPKAAEMNPINVSNVVVLDNPSAFSNPLQFDITFDCYENLEQDLTWTVTYVGCADDWRHDQVLEVMKVFAACTNILRLSMHYSLQ